MPSTTTTKSNNSSTILSSDSLSSAAVSPFSFETQRSSSPITSNNFKDKVRYTSNINSVNSQNNNNLYDVSTRLVSSNLISSKNPKNTYHKRRLISEQALRSRLNMLDRNTLLEEFLRFFHFYYYDQHNQKGDNQVGNSDEEEGTRSNVNNFNEAFISNSSPVKSSPAINGHNENNKSNRYSLETTEDYYGDY